MKESIKSTITRAYELAKPVVCFAAVCVVASSALKVVNATTDALCRCIGKIGQ